MPHQLNTGRPEQRMVQITLPADDARALLAIVRFGAKGGPIGRDMVAEILFQGSQQSRIYNAIYAALGPEPDTLGDLVIAYRMQMQDDHDSAYRLQMQADLDSAWEMQTRG